LLNWCWDWSSGLGLLRYEALSYEYHPHIWHDELALILNLKSLPVAWEACEDWEDVEGCMLNIIGNIFSNIITYTWWHA
jgi:hypothetical protein